MYNVDGESCGKNKVGQRDVERRGEGKPQGRYLNMGLNGVRENPVNIWGGLWVEGTMAL